MEFTSVPEGHALTVQSWIPFMKSVSPAPLGQPRLGAKASMFLTHVCYHFVSSQFDSRSSATDSPYAAGRKAVQIRRTLCHRCTSEQRGSDHEGLHCFARWRYLDGDN